VIVEEAPSHLRRRFDPETGFALIAYVLDRGELADETCRIVPDLLEGPDAAHLRIVRYSMQRVFELAPWRTGTQKLWMTSVARSSTRRPCSRLQLVRGRRDLCPAGLPIAQLPPELLADDLDDAVRRLRPRERDEGRHAGGEQRGEDHERQHDPGRDDADGGLAIPYGTAAAAADGIGERTKDEEVERGGDGDQEPREVRDGLRGRSRRRKRGYGTHPSTLQPTLLPENHADDE